MSDTENDTSGPQPQETRPWPVGRFVFNDTVNKDELLAANQNDCLVTLGRGMNLAFERRDKLWACHVCDKNVGNQGVGEGSKQEDKKDSKGKDKEEGEEKPDDMYNGLTPCQLCGAAWYCSEECRQEDWMVHTLLCTQYRVFQQTGPEDQEPSDNKVIGIELPVDGTEPRLVWLKYSQGYSNRPREILFGGAIRTTFVIHQDGFYSLGETLGGMPQYIKTRGPSWSTCLYVTRRQSSLLQPANECVAFLLRKLGPLAFASMRGFLDPARHMQDDKLFWRGPIVLFRRMETFLQMKPAAKKSPLGGPELRVMEAHKMEDMTLADFSRALEYLAWRQLEVVEHPETKYLVPEEWSQWVRCISGGEELE